MHLVTLSGSPAAPSRSGWLLQRAAAGVRRHAHSSHDIVLRDLPAEALVTADARHPALVAAIEQVLAADVLLVATPIYKAAYSGLLKVFLDLLPPDALRGTRVLPIATGGSPGHLLALDYALKPVLGALGARHIGDAVYGVDSLLPRDVSGQYQAAPELEQRLARAVDGLLASLPAAQEPQPQQFLQSQSRPQSQSQAQPQLQPHSQPEPHVQPRPPVLAPWTAAC